MTHLQQITTDGVFPKYTTNGTPIELNQKKEKGRIKFSSGAASMILTVRWHPKRKKYSVSLPMWTRKKKVEVVGFTATHPERLLSIIDNLLMIPKDSVATTADTPTTGKAFTSTEKDSITLTGSL